MIGGLVLMLAAFQLAASKEYLLPGDVEPVHYDVRLLYDVDHAKNFPYYGVVDIKLKVKQATSHIVLHASGYTIANDSIKLVGENDSPQVKVVGLDTKYDLLNLETDQNLNEGEIYSLSIPFFGNLNLGLDGVYVSTYVHKVTKAKEYLIATQFEAISARKGFPCFDEPIYKATFRITLGHNKNYTAVSNMPLNSSTDDNALEPYWSWDGIEEKFKKPISEFVWDEFNNSVPMSTYLVAFVISKFQFVDSPPALSTTKFRIWARSDAIDQTAYAATIGPKVLTHFENWFNVSFPLPKQDMVAIPDFAAGAMENWGLITYRETALLYDKEQSSFLSKERVAEVIAHELAHQWFGNLVTMKWWSDLWLNEGFATFMASIGVAAVEPTWRADRTYAVENILSVFGLDALESSHPVSVAIENPTQISEIFDEISYRKGSTLIRMMEMFLGETVFREALYNYLMKYSYQNAEQDDLWAELTDVNKKHGGLSRNVSVKEVMDTWTTQTGYPLLTVHRDYSDGTLTIKQKRYLARGLANSTKASWWVPLRVLCEEEVGQEETPLQWLGSHEGVSSLHRFEHGSKSDQWVLFNSDMVAPYRVNYDERNWALLSQALASESYTKVPVLGRVQLLTDAFELAWTNILDYNTTLQLVKYLRRETEVLPLSTALNQLGNIDNVLKRTPDYGAFQKFVRHLIGETYARVGGLFAKRILDKDNLNSVKMQVLTSNWACRMKLPGCEENAIELFQSWMMTENPDENNPIPLDLRRTVYCVALSRGSVQHWRFALARKQGANVAAARDALLYSLACTKDVWILSQYLEWTVQPDSEVRKHEAAAVITAVTRSTVGYYIAKDFIYTRIEDISKTFDGQNRRMGAIVKVLLNQFTSQRELDEFLKWRDQNAKYLDEAKLAVEQAIEQASVNIGWLQRNRRNVVNKLRELSKDDDTWTEDEFMNAGSWSNKVTYTWCGTTILYIVFMIITQFV